MRGGRFYDALEYQEKEEEERFYDALEYQGGKITNGKKYNEWIKPRKVKNQRHGRRKLKKR